MIQKDKKIKQIRNQIETDNRPILISTFARRRPITAKRIAVFNPDFPAGKDDECRNRISEM